MKIRYFLPLAVVIVAALSAFAHRSGVPVPPIAVISTIGCALLALQLEDHKLGDLLANLARALKGERHAESHK